MVQGSDRDPTLDAARYRVDRRRLRCRAWSAGDADVG